MASTSQPKEDGPPAIPAGNTNLPEPSHQHAMEDKSNGDIPTSMELLSTNAIGMDVDSNCTEIDNGDGNSAIGPSIYSPTYSIRCSLYDSVENGRTYHRFKEGKYYLPNDEVSS